MNSSTTETPNSTSVLGDDAIVAEHYAFFLAANILELFGHVALECPISALNFYLVLGTSILHQNLKFILLCQSTTIFARAIGRIALQVTRFAIQDIDWQGSTALILLYKYPMYFRNLVAHSLLLERILATACVQTYEQWNKPHFSIAWFSTTTALTVWNLYSYTSAGHPTLVTCVTTAVIMALSGVEIGAFVWLWRYNDRKYRDQRFQQHNLSQRYQLAENIRTAKQLMPALCLHLVNIFLNGTVNLTYRFCVDDTQGAPWGQFVYALVEQICQTAVTYADFLIELTILIYHPFLRRDLHQLVKQMRALFTGNLNKIGTEKPMQMTITMKGIGGERMVFSQRTEEYFGQLNQMWNYIPDQVRNGADQNQKF